MAVIRRYPFLRHLRSTPNRHVVQVRGGKVRRSGTGQAFWFRPATAALSEVPVDDRELPLIVHARTADFQDVTVQATVAYRVTAPETAAARLDFSIDPERGSWHAAPLEQLAQILTELAQRHALAAVAELPLPAAITAIAPVRDRVAAGLAGEGRLQQLGVGVVAVGVVAIRPESELERALQTPARETVQAEADRAGFERRALAVERERAIAENELQSRIELAAREERLVAQHGANERRRAEEAAAAGRIRAEADAERERTAAAARADCTRLLGLAEGEAESARLAAYAQLDRGTLLALALREAAGRLPEIGSLTVTPDLLTGALGRLVEPGDRR